MDKVHFSKQEVVRAYNKLVGATRDYNEIAEAIRDEIAWMLARLRGAAICMGGRMFLLEGNEVIVSVFGNFIKLFFVRKGKELRKWKPDADLTPEEREEDMAIMAAYLDGKISPGDLLCGLSSDTGSVGIQLTLEPELEDLADIYDTGRLNVLDEDGEIILQYGLKGVVRIPK